MTTDERILHLTACFVCGAVWATAKSRSIHELRKHPGMHPPADLARERVKAAASRSNRKFRAAHYEAMVERDRRYNAEHRLQRSIANLAYKTAHAEELRAKYIAYRNSPAGRATDDRAYKRKMANGAKMAINAVRKALVQGRLERLPCEVCGAISVEAHHYLGYAREHRLDVRWLCIPHHREAHGRTARARSMESAADRAAGLTLGLA